MTQIGKLIRRARMFPVVEDDWRGDGGDRGRCGGEFVRWVRTCEQGALYDQQKSDANNECNQ